MCHADLQIKQTNWKLGDDSAGGGCTAEEVGGVGVWGNLDDFSVTDVHIKLENFSVLDGLRRGCGNRVGCVVCENESLLIMWFPQRSICKFACHANHANRANGV